MIYNKFAMDVIVTSIERDDAAISSGPIVTTPFPAVCPFCQHDSSMITEIGPIETTIPTVLICCRSICAGRFALRWGWWAFKDAYMCIMRIEVPKEGR